MAPLIVEHREELLRLCRRHGLRRMDVFGSATTGDWDPERSDIDLLVDFGDMASREVVQHYFAIHEALEALLGRKVDLVMEGAIRSPYFRRGVEETRKVLYAA